MNRYRVVQLEDLLTKKDDNSKRLYYLLVKEDFRAVVTPNYDESYIIDSSEYSGIPNTVGCFLKNDKWIVYETDDRSQIIMKVEFDDPVEAYSCAAKRRSLLFYPSRAALLALNGPVSFFDYSELLSAVSSAITNLELISKASSGMPAYRSIRDDINFLAEERNKIDRRFRHLGPQKPIDVLYRNILRLSDQIHFLSDQISKKPKEANVLSVRRRRLVRKQQLQLQELKERDSELYRQALLAMNTSKNVKA